MKKQLQLDEAQALKLYPNASDEFKQMLEDSFGKAFFSKKLIDRISTYEQVCEELGEDCLTIGSFKQFESHLRKKLLNQAKLLQIANLFNEDWKPNWGNKNQYKYYNWFKYENSRLVFGSCGSGSYVPTSGLVFFKDPETAVYIGKTFIDIYNELL